MSYNVYLSSSVHNIGTKFYDIYIIQDADRNLAVVVQNWGKNGRTPTRINTGQIKVTTYSSCSNANSYAINKRSEKENRGYVEDVGGFRHIVSSGDKDVFIRRVLNFFPGRAEYKEILDHFGFTTIELSSVLAADDIDLTSLEKSKPKPAPVINDPIWGSW